MKPSENEKKPFNSKWYIIGAAVVILLIAFSLKMNVLNSQKQEEGLYYEEVPKEEAQPTQQQPQDIVEVSNKILSFMPLLVSMMVIISVANIFLRNRE